MDRRRRIGKLISNIPRNMKKALLLSFFLPALCFTGARAQTGEGAAKELVTETFYGNRTINLHTVETMKKKTLGYRIVHRFSGLESGPYHSFGLDGPATIGFQFEYGISDKFTVGLSHMTWNKMFSVNAKYKLLAQTKDNSTPFTLTGYLKAGYNNTKTDDMFGIGNDSVFTPFTNRMTFVAQVMLARKFGERLSVQLSPTLIHYNLDYGTYLSSAHSNDIFAITGQLSYKIGKRMALNLEYTHVLNNGYLDAAAREFYFDNIGVGLDIKTGGHVFQVVFINAFAIDEEFAIPFNFSNFTDWDRNDGVPGGFRLGFNIQRDFHL
jgi:Membrane bound beta barrel domain (DUF5777)